MKILIILVNLSISQFCWGRDFHVDPDTGHDGHDGIVAPVRTIARGLQLAGPGDTVHLQPKVYRDFVGFSNRHGEPERPIILDGHGATLEGSKPIDPDTWKEVAPGRFCNGQLIPHLDAGRIQRWFFIWNGKMNHMGRTSKGIRTPFKSPEELQPGEWTFVEETFPGSADPSKRKYGGSFYIQLDPGQSLAEANVTYPARINGVQLGGTNSHLVIRNITSTHFGNDGFNIHGDCHNVLFENICAIECGDDGISAHGTAKYRVEGLVSIGNSTGICDTVLSQTHYNSVYIRDCLAYDLFFLDQGNYAVRNAVIHSSSQNPISVNGRSEENLPCRLELENILFLRKTPGKNAYVGKNTILTASRCTFLNLGILVNGGAASWKNSVITGTPGPVITVRQNGVWSGERNHYDLDQIKFENEAITMTNFKTFQDRTGQESGSQWRQFISLENNALSLPSGPGVDQTRLPKSRPDSTLP
ncbi:MAG TPA: hypothetical protein VNQ76_11425 [Planctomicrobium sp.]|nr:hypothetical protein [Planctomicrobium sp.]